MKATRIQRIVSTMQYLITYSSAPVEDDIFDQIRELLSHEEIEYRADVICPDDPTSGWIVEIGAHLLN